MTRSLTIEPAAIRGYKRIAGWITLTFGKKVAQKFAEGFYKHTGKIRARPASYPIYGSWNGSVLHRSVYNKRTIVLYYFDDSRVYIVKIVDGRTNWQADV